MIYYPYTFRFKLMIIFVVSILVLAIIMMVSLPLYFTNIMKKENEILIESTLTAVENNINSYFDELERLTISPYFNSEFMESILTLNSEGYIQLSEYEKFLIRQSIHTTLSYYLQTTKEDITSALFVANDYTSFISTKKYGFMSLPENYDVKNSIWYKEAKDEGKSFVYINAHQQDYIQSTDVVFSVARLIKDPVTQRDLGVLMADVDKNIIEKTVKDLNFGVSSILVVLDSQNQLIYSTHHITEEVVHQLDKKDVKRVVDDQNPYQVITKSFEALPWKMYVLTSEKELQSKIKGMYIVGGLLIFMAITVVAILYTILSNHLTQPFTEMLETISLIEKGDLTHRFQESGKDEIAYLSHNLNNMLEQINQLIEQEYQATIEKQKAEFFALQSQIQPHFLYNTLNGIIGLNRLGEKKKVEQSVLNLTKLMRYILDHEDISTLEDEVKLLISYCELQKLRFNDRMNYTIEMDASVKDVLIPKLLLQPVVENAIIHGLEPKVEDGHLLIKISSIKKQAQDEQVQDKQTQHEQIHEKYGVEINISDDGVGFKASDIIERESVGIMNVKKRLKFMYKDSSFSIDSYIQRGTIVQIQIFQPKKVGDINEDYSS